MKYDTIVVGGGKFGCVIAAALSVLEGQKVLLLDDDRPMGGSKPSGGLMKPSWINMMSKKDMNEGFNTLSLLYGIEDVQLNMFGSKLVKVTAHHIQVDK